MQQPLLLYAEVDSCSAAMMLRSLTLPNQTGRSLERKQLHLAEPSRTSMIGLYRLRLRMKSMAKVLRARKGMILVRSCARPRVTHRCLVCCILWRAMPATTSCKVNINLQRPLLWYHHRSKVSKPQISLLNSRQRDLKCLKLCPKSLRRLLLLPSDECC